MFAGNASDRDQAGSDSVRDSRERLRHGRAVGEGAGATGRDAAVELTSRRDRVQVYLFTGIARVLFFASHICASKKASATLVFSRGSRACEIRVFVFAALVFYAVSLVV